MVIRVVQVYDIHSYVPGIEKLCSISRDSFSSKDCLCIHLLNFLQLKVYKDRKALGHALDDTKTAVKQLNKLVTGILIVVTILVWLLLSEIATTKVIVVLSTQLVAATFMIGHTCKTIFEAVIFVFVMHPFDVGDRCVVDGIPVTSLKLSYLFSYECSAEF